MTRSILIVDDEPDICDVLKRVCEREGDQVLVAQNADEGLAILLDKPIDVVVTDIIMPGMDGVSFVRKIKEHSPQTRVVAISGGGEQGANAYKPEAISTSAFLLAAETAGADVTLTKPFGRAEIIEAMR